MGVPVVLGLPLLALLRATFLATALLRKPLLFFSLSRGLFSCLFSLTPPFLSRFLGLLFPLKLLLYHPSERLSVPTYPHVEHTIPLSRGNGEVQVKIDCPYGRLLVLRWGPTRRGCGRHETVGRCRGLVGGSIHRSMP